VLSPPPDIRQDLGDLLQSGAGADVTFQVGGGPFVGNKPELDPCMCAGLERVCARVWE
jgi:hypothetical protein